MLTVIVSIQNSSIIPFVDSGQMLDDLDALGIDVGDVNSNYDLDIFLTNGQGPSKVGLNDGHGIFTDRGQNFRGTRKMLLLK